MSNEESISTILLIFPDLKESDAISILNDNGGNVEKAVQQMFEGGGNDAKANKRKASEGGTSSSYTNKANLNWLQQKKPTSSSLSSAFTTSSSSSSSKTASSISSPGKSNWLQQGSKSLSSSSSSLSTATSSSPIKSNRLQELSTSSSPSSLSSSSVSSSNHGTTIPSKEYTSLLLSNLTIDSTFPPASTSITGRPTSISNTTPTTTTSSSSSSSSQKQQTCRCPQPSNPPMIKSVQKSGANYGRFYVTCSKQSNPITRTLSCNYFHWVDEGSDLIPSLPIPTTLTQTQREVIWVPFNCSSASKPMTKLFASASTVNACVSPKHVRQGRLGDCWFLSALAVIANRPDLILRLISSIPNNASSKDGLNFYEVSLFLDGEWKQTIVDSYLPCVVENVTKTNQKEAAVYKQLSERGRLTIPSSLVIANNPTSNNNNDNKSNTTTTTCSPVYAKTPTNIAWPAIVEKAYAKAHGSYNILSGGHISEAFFDLLGCPTETIYFNRNRNSNNSSSNSNDGENENENGVDDIMTHDEIWATLASYGTSDFLLGASCMISDGDSNLVGCHAYSLLEVREVYGNFVIGRQEKVNDHFGKKGRKKVKFNDGDDGDDDDDDVLEVDADGSEVIIPSKQPETGSSTQQNETQFSLRFVKLRNPWGKAEGKGRWGKESSCWTTKLRALLAVQSNEEMGGVFWMAYDDFVRKFSSVDVCKIHEGWVSGSFGNCFVHDVRSGGKGKQNESHHQHQHPSTSTNQSIVVNPYAKVPKHRQSQSKYYGTLKIYSITVGSPCWGYFSLVQQKKRAMTKSRYYYLDAQMLVIKRPKNSSESSESGWVAECCVLSGQRRISSVEVFMDVSMEYMFVMFSTTLPSFTSLDWNDFRFFAYTSVLINVTEHTCGYDDGSGNMISKISNSLFFSLLSTQKKYKHHVLGPSSLLSVIKGDGSIYFVIHNASPFNVKVDLTIRGTGVRLNGSVLGVVNSWYVEAGCSKIAAMCLCTGDELSLHYSYSADLSECSKGGGESGSGSGSELLLFANGDLLGISAAVEKEAEEACTKLASFDCFVCNGSGDLLAINGDGSV